MKFNIIFNIIFNLNDETDMKLRFKIVLTTKKSEYCYVFLKPTKKFILFLANYIKKPIKKILQNKTSISFFKILYKIMPKRIKKIIKNRYHKYFSKQNIENDFLRYDFNHSSYIINELYEELKNENNY